MSTLAFASTKGINDPEIDEALERNATSREKKQAAITAEKRLIEQLEFELEIFRNAAAQFSIFFKRNAIMSYNDTTLEYLYRHLEVERSKMVAGGSRDKLERLTYVVRTAGSYILDDYMKKGEDHMLLDQASV